MSPMPFDVEMQLHRHGAALRSLAGEIVRDPWAADDAVQEVWLGALRRPPPHATAIGGWLATAMRNVVRGFGRKQRRSERRERAVAEARGAVAEDHAAVLAREEQAQRLLAAVRTLEAPFRDAIWQRYFEGRAPREIAARSGVPCATVKSRLQRGLQQLRTRLGDENGPGWRGALAVAFGCQGTVVPVATAAFALPGVLLMATWTKVMAGVAALAAAGVVLWSLADPGVASSRPAIATGPETAAAITGAPVAPETGAREERTLLTPAAPPADATTREVRVLDEAGAAVPGATVWFVKPGFAYADLPAEQADRYSRATESWLRDFGLSRFTDEHGRTNVPIEAAQHAVIARKDNRYGRNWPRSEGAFQEIVVSARHTLVVETVDANGTAVPHVQVVGQPVPPNGLVNPMAQWTLGTTDDHGRLTQLLEAPTAANPVAQIRLHAQLLDGPHGEQRIDALTPPAFVRIVLPDTGTVRVRLQNADGSALDRRTLGSLAAELGLVGAQHQIAMFAQLSGSSPKLHYAYLDAEGNARFEHVVFGKNLQLRFPGMIMTTKVFAGPSETQRAVTIAQTVDPDHPFITGTLADPDGRAMGDADFTVMDLPGRDLLLSRAGKTDADGRFLVWLTDRCTSQRDVSLQFGMDWSNTGPTRQVTVAARGPLLGRVDLGRVVMPLAK